MMSKHKTIGLWVGKLLLPGWAVQTGPALKGCTGPALMGCTGPALIDCTGPALTDQTGPDCTGPALALSDCIGPGPAPALSD